MGYFVLQIKTGREEIFLKQVRQWLLFREKQQRFFFPQRELIIRRRGKLARQLRPLFPGYIFVEAEKIDPELYNIARFMPDFFRFLRDNHHITPLCDRDLALIRHFVSFGEVVGRSQVFFDDNDRIVVTNGPLKGLEG
ncbi:MAG: hypothetical protein LBS64_05445, partial [Spirochaetaceae bacterium]|nr:hypothetical protein [Spirochaetaceae bacterium]